MQHFSNHRTRKVTSLAKMKTRTKALRKPERLTGPSNRLDVVRWSYTREKLVLKRLYFYPFRSACFVQGVDGPTLGSLGPLYHEFTIEGFETVTLRVDVNNREDEEKALQTARQFMLAHSSST